MDSVEVPVGRREKRKQEIRGRIEDAAYHLFKTQGIDETSIEQICVEADVARRAFYGHFPNKYALLGGLGISRVYNQSEPMLRDLMTNHQTTRARLGAMIDYIESNFSGYQDIDRQLFLLGPVAFAQDREQQREVSSSSMAGFTRLITAGRELGDVKTNYSPEIMASVVVGTLNMLTMSWAMDVHYPIFAKLEEARSLFESLICQ